MVQTIKEHPNKKYYGGSTVISVHPNPPKVFPGQQSFGLMALGNGLESFEVGWMVGATYLYIFIVYITY